MADGTGTVATRPLTLLGLALAWLGVTAGATQATITGGGLAGTLGTAVAALPGLVTAAVVVGASVGAAAAGRRRAGGRLAAGLVLGTLLGAAAAIAVRFAYGDDPAVAALAVIVGAACVAGGALAVLPRDVLAAGLWGATWVFLAGLILGLVRPGALGGAEAAGIVPGLVTGLVAGAATGAVLRRRRVPWYAVGGALPGLVLLGAEGLTRTGGPAAAALAHASAAPVADPARHAFTVLAVGGATAMLAGALRGLRRRRKPAGEAPERAGPDLADLDAFRRTLARIGLGAAQRYGFALAGGYAVRAAGFLDRPTDDIDLFTAWERRDEFETAARAVIDAYRAAGLSVDAQRRHDTFTRLTVSDGARRATVELGVDSRAHEPVPNAIGPVLHPDDAVANKMRAIYERAHACDFIDIDAVLRSGRYARSRLLELAGRADITFDVGVFADALARAQTLGADDFAPYGLGGADLDGLRHRFARWRAELLDARPAG